MAGRSHREAFSNTLGKAVRGLRRVWRFFATGRLAALLVLAALTAVQWLDPAPVEILRTRAFDLYQEIRPRSAPERTQVAVADLDEKSLAAYGQWPWPRTLVAQLVLALNRAGAAAIGFDIVFAEGDRTSPEYASRFMVGLDDATFEKLQASPRNDAVLAEQIEAAPVVLGQSAATILEQQQETPAPGSSVNTIGNVAAYLPRFPGLLRNLPEFESVARGIGVFSLLPERDGIVRRIPTAIAVGDAVFPALSIELLRVATGSASIDIRAGSPGGVNALRVPPLLIPTDPLGRVWVYFTPWNTSRTYSVRDILEGSVGADELRGRIVLIGTSATGLLDMRSTPLESVVPGVEVHAQALDMILANDYLRRPAWVRSLELLCTVFTGLLMILVVPTRGAFAALSMGAAVTGAIAAGSWLLFANRGILFDATWPLAAAVAVLGLLVLGSYFREQTEKRRIRGTFSQYLSPALVERLANDPNPVQLGGETREMTMLFCDIRGFTTISERYKSNPQRLTAMINRLLTPLSRAVLDHGGTIDKYIGDCIMAFWNAPVRDPTHRRNACAAALAMRAALAEVNARSAEEGASEPIRIGIGINTGAVVVGNMGSEMRFDYSVLGDAVNLAARLEGQSKNYGVEIVVGEETAAALGDEFAFVELDLIAVKGRSEGVRIFSLKGDAETAADAGFRASRQRHARMLKAYRGRRWKEAAAEAETLRRQPGMQAGYYELMLERIASFRRNPPPDDWDGVYVAEAK